MKVLYPLDLTNQELQNAVLQALGSEPSYASGKFYLLTTDNHMYIMADSSAHKILDDRDAYNHPTQSAINLDLTGAQVLDVLSVDTNGHVSSATYRTLTPSDLGAVAYSEKGSANGVATLDSGGKIPQGQLPAIGLTDVYVVADETAQLALDAQEGDVAIRTDEGKTYIHNGGTSDTMSDWSEMLSPGEYVHPTQSAINIDTTGAQVIDTLTVDTLGHTTAVTLRTITPADIGASSVYQTLVGNGSATSFIINHGKGENVVSSIKEVSTGEHVLANVVDTGTSQVTVSFSAAPTTDQYSVTIIGQ